MSYESVKLALNPVAWYRNDEESGPTMLDSSGNDLHREYSNPDIQLGQASGVETVPTSKSVYGIAEPITNWEVVLGDEFDSRVHFTWEALVRAAADGTMTIISRNEHLNALIFTGSSPSVVMRFALHVGGTSYAVDSNINMIVNQWYHVFGIRNGATMFAMVNGANVGSRSDLPASTPITVDTPTDEIGLGGTSHNQTFPWSGWEEEFTFYDYALTEAQARSITEAMFGSLQLAGFSNVISTAVLYSDVEPAPISFPFRHNWVDDWIERISFATGVSTARKGYEQGVGQRVKPRREIEITQVLKDDTERRMFRAKLNANQHRKWLVPMLDDRQRLIGSVASGVNVFAVDTLYRDYEIGGQFGIRQLNDTGRIAHWEELLITGLTDTQITTATNTVNSYTNPEVYPVRRAIIAASQSLRGHTDAIEETSVLARLVAEDEKVIPHRIIEWTPATTYHTHEVFSADEWPNNWVELRDYEVSRVREEVDFELGPFAVESDAIGASEVFSWRIILQTKQQQAEFLGWFYAHAGSLNYLWVPTMQRDFAIVSAVGSDLTVEDHNYFDNYAASEYRRDIAFVYNDNSMILRRVNSVVVAGANETLTLDAAVPTQTNLRSVSYLLFCRLDNDTLERAAATDNKVQFAWLFREVLSSPA